MNSVEAVEETVYPHRGCSLDYSSNNYIPRLPPTAGYIKKIGRFIHNQILISHEFPSVRKYFNSFQAVQSERKRQYHSAHWYVIHPLSRFAMYWKSLMVVVWLLILPYDLYMIAFLQCFEERRMWSTTMYIITFYRKINGFLFIDFLCRLITGYVDEKTEACILNPREIILRYLKSPWLWVDLYWVYYIVRLIANRNIRSSRIVNLVRYIRVIRLVTVVKDLQIFIIDVLGSTYGNYMSVSLILCGLFFWHLNACFLCFMAQLASEQGDFGINWLKRVQDLYMNHGRQTTCLNLYFHAVAEVMSVFNLGNFMTSTTLSPIEIITLTICCLVGYACKGVFITVLYINFSSRYTLSMRDNFSRQKLRNYFNIRNIPIDTTSRIIDYFDRRYDKTSPCDIFSNSSTNLRLRMCLAFWKCKIETTELFKSMPFSLKEKLCSKLELELFLPGQTIYKANETARVAYYLCTGEVSIYREQNELHHIISPNYMGVSAFFINDIKEIPKRSHTAVAAEYCEMLTFQRKDIIWFAFKHPEFALVLKTFEKDIVIELNRYYA